MNTPNKQAEKIGNLELNKVYCMDALELLSKIDDKSVDMILCDLPYGKTNLEWDKKNIVWVRE